MAVSLVHVTRGLFHIDPPLEGSPLQFTSELVSPAIIKAFVLSRFPGIKIDGVYLMVQAPAGFHRIYEPQDCVEPWIAGQTFWVRTS